MYSEASEIVSEAAREDRSAAVETWGPEAFARRTRAAVHGYRLPPAPGNRRGKGIPSGINILLLGPTGSGKSSLIYTWFRSLSGSVAQREDFFRNAAHQSLLQRLSVGWNGEDILRDGAPKGVEPWSSPLGTSNGANGASSSASVAAKGSASGGSAGTENSDSGSTNGGSSANGDSGFGSDLEIGGTLGASLAAAPRHGTTAFDAYELQAAAADGSTGGIAVHDTKGQQFFTPEEESYAEQLLLGKLRPGSSTETRNYRYWFMLGQFGFVSTADLATSPHVLVLVFDVTLRSFENMLFEGPTHELSVCYRRILLRARQQGHEVFAALTHIDAYRPPEPRGGASSGGEQAFDRSRDLPPVLSRWKSQLSAALADSRQPGVAPDRIFPVENYRRDRTAADSVLELAALEFLESTVRAGCRYIQRRHSQQQGCNVA